MSDPGLAFRSTAAVERRVDAIEAAFEARGLKPAAFIDQATRMAEEEWVPQNGAQVVAKAWTDPAFRQRLFANGRDAVAELGIDDAAPPPAPRGAREHADASTTSSAARCARAPRSR